ncbi:MAG: hypothetical protein A3G81_27830 [Betaproteobacteria bacterium RIFCSPLOWO2_12_FULL_65_14]|nr:MAG: hypothetical protein A3G81_27830 [Betaproteobacteria bacterium RIFCSPLOWO2_12_FULL_65_14]
MHPSFLKAVLAGFVGTLAMTAMMYFVAPMMGLTMDIAAMLGSLMGGNWTAGMMLHFINGSIIFPAIYAYVLYDRLPGSPVARGTLWGIALWLLAQVVVMPMMGGGLFSSAMGGMMAAMGSFVGHVIYGSLLGAIASAPMGRRVAHA